MGRRRRARPKTQAEEGSRIFAFPLELEPLARRLYDLVYRGAEAVIREVEDPTEIKRSPEVAARLFAAAHRGFAQAQDEVLAYLTSEQPRSDAEHALCRKMMDGVAWQMLRDQLYLARQLYRGHRQPSLANSNYEAVRVAAAELTSADFSTFALMADLTSFVQVGDLLIVNRETGMTLAEVKEGAVNERILQLFHAATQPERDAAFAELVTKGGKKAIDQMGRVLRQGERMAHVTDVATTGDSVDPDTGVRVLVPDEPLVMQSWDEALVGVLEESRRSGYAIEIVDKCLFIGAYRDRFRLAGPLAFEAWLKGASKKDGLPSANLMRSMVNPLALPIFSRRLPREHMFDIAFGRAVVHVGLHMDAFIDLCNESGLPTRWSTRKEAGRFTQSGPGPWLLDHRAVLTGEGPGQGPIADGTFVRLFFHGTRPVTMVEMLKRLRDEQTARGDEDVPDEGGSGPPRVRVP